MKRTTVELPVWQWERLAEISKETKKQPGGGYTRDEVVSHFLSWAFQQWDEEKKRRAKR